MMRSWLLILLVATILPGCGSSALTETECRTIQDKELAYLSANFAQAGKSLDKSWAKDKIDRGIAKCLSGSIYTRKDYECMISARTNEQMSLCLATAHERAP